MLIGCGGSVGGGETVVLEGGEVVAVGEGVVAVLRPLLGETGGWAVPGRDDGVGLLG